MAIGKGRILALEPLEANADPGAIDLDLSACTVLPALVDAHVHLTMSGSADPKRRQGQLEMGAHTAAATIARHLGQHQTHGVAAVRDGGDHWGHTLAYKCKAGRGPVHLAAAGRAWHAAGRYGRLIGRPPRGAGGLGANIRRCPDHGDHVKLVNSGLNSLKSFGKETAPQFCAADLQTAVVAAEALGLPVMVHANGRRPVAEAVAAGCTSIEHGFFMGRANLEAMAAKGTVWVPTTVTMAAYARYLTRQLTRRRRSPGEDFGGAASGADLDVVRRNRDHQLAQLRLASQLGVRVAVGTDAGSLGVDHGRAVAAEMALLAQAGYPIEAVVQAATSNGADLMGLSDRGRLGPGLRADFIAVAGPPGTLITGLAHPPGVYLAGVLQRPGSALSSH
jgi:imidazolonepropionase-like amidohydrolase